METFSQVFLKSGRLLSPSWASLVLRLTFGLLMIINHGMPKYYGYAERSGQFYNLFGLGSELSLQLAIFAEVICSLFIILGLGLRFALIPLIFTMLVAIFGAGADQPVLKSELALVYLGAFIALFLLGSGRFSVDALMNKRN